MKLRKKDIAEHQIDTAIGLFFEGKHLLLMTALTDTDEEIHEKLLQRASQSNMMKCPIDVVKRQTGAGWDYKLMYIVAQAIQNNVKHANNCDEDEIEVSFDYMISMLVRAVANYTALAHAPSPLMRKFGAHLIALYPDLPAHIR